MGFKIYTKTGDKGTTGLFGGKRVPKNDLRIEAYGTVDELNVHVGLVRDALTDEATREALKSIQDRLFTIGAILATDPDKEMPTPDLHEADIQMLESAMDAMDEVLPALKNFILPGGHLTVSYCHLARVVCRRAERLTVALHEVAPVEPLAMRYLNRLSDYFFVLGRYVGQQLGAEEVTWQPRQPS